MAGHSCGGVVITNAGAVGGDLGLRAPATADTTPTGTQRLEVTHAEMNAAHDSGEAIPCTETIPWLGRYDNSWWVVYDHGWLRITDILTAADLGTRALRTPGSPAQ